MPVKKYSNKKPIPRKRKLTVKSRSRKITKKSRKLVGGSDSWAQRFDNCSSHNNNKNECNKDQECMYIKPQNQCISKENKAYQINSPNYRSGDSIKEISTPRKSIKNKTGISRLINFLRFRNQKSPINSPNISNEKFNAVHKGIKEFCSRIKEQNDCNKKDCIWNKNKNKCYPRIFNQASNINSLTPNSASSPSPSHNESNSSSINNS